jgi:putative transposase
LCYNPDVRKTFKYRVCPTKGQARLLIRTLEECRWLYNQTLAYRRDRWQRDGESVNWYETKARIPALKAERPALKLVYSQTLQDVTARVDLAFKAFFRRCKAGETPGYPRFRGFGRYDSFTYPQTGFKLDGDRLDLSKIGRVEIILHRPVEGEIKTLTIRRSSTGKWFACFSVETEPAALPESGRVVGIDVGLEHFATLSTGEHIPNPRFFRRDQRALAKAQRKLAVEAKGTPERVRRRKVVAHIHERIANRRADHAHQLSRRLVDTYGLIAFEDLTIPNLLQNRHLAKSIADAAWNQLVTFTTYKAECADRQVVRVDPRNTSQRCSRCGMRVEKTLSERVHACPFCGLTLQRDINAAINILALGLQRRGERPRSPSASAEGE